MQLLNKGFQAFQYKIYYALCHVLPPSFFKAVFKKCAASCLSKSFECVLPWSWGLSAIVQDIQSIFWNTSCKDRVLLFVGLWNSRNNTLLQSFSFCWKKKTKQGTTGGPTELLEFMGSLLLLCVTPRADRKLPRYKDQKGGNKWSWKCLRILVS